MCYYFCFFFIKNTENNWTSTVSPETWLSHHPSLKGQNQATYQGEEFNIGASMISQQSGLLQMNCLRDEILDGVELRGD